LPFVVDVTLALGIGVDRPTTAAFKVAAFACEAECETRLSVINEAELKGNAEAAWFARN
jgi:hypothetical protein